MKEAIFKLSSGSHFRADFSSAGKELFYWSPDNTLLSVPITLKPDGVEVGAAHSLLRFNNSLGTVGIVSPYDASSDGQHFVLITTPEQTPRPATLATNWTVELKSK